MRVPRCELDARSSDSEPPYVGLAHAEEGPVEGSQPPSGGAFASTPRTAVVNWVGPSQPLTLARLVGGSKGHVRTRLGAALEHEGRRR